MRPASVSAPREPTDAATEPRDAPIRPQGLGTLTAVLLPAARAARALGAACAGLALLAACGGAGGGRAAAEQASTTTTTELRRAVPPPQAGALSTYIAAAEAEAPDDELLLFGDSVALLLADELAVELERPLVVDAVDCRRLDLGFTGPCGGVPAGTPVAAALDDLAPATDRLEDPARAAAVVVLANNAALRAADLDAAMAALAPIPRVWWVTARVGGRAWQDPNNALLVDLAARDPRAAVVDWFGASEGQAWLADNVHPDDAGQAALAGLVADHVRCDCTP